MLHLALVPEKGWCARNNHRDTQKHKKTNVTSDCVAGTTVYMTLGTDNHCWMPTMMVHHYPSLHLTPPKTRPGKNTQESTWFCIHIMQGIVFFCHLLVTYVPDPTSHTSLSCGVKEQLGRIPQRQSKPEEDQRLQWVYLLGCIPNIAPELLRRNIFVIVRPLLMFPSLNFATFSNTVSTAEAHTIECGGFPQRAAQNSAWHCVLHCRCKHLHSEFMFVLLASTCH